MVDQKKMDFSDILHNLSLVNGIDHSRSDGEQGFDQEKEIRKENTLYELYVTYRILYQNGWSIDKLTNLKVPLIDCNDRVISNQLTNLIDLYMEIGFPPINPEKKASALMAFHMMTTA